MTRELRIDDLLDYGRYPLDDTTDPRYRDTVADARAQLAADGCAVIQNLLRPTAVSLISSEIVSRKHTTHFSTSSMNPYFHTTPNPDS